MNKLGNRNIAVGFQSAKTWIYTLQPAHL